MSAADRWAIRTQQRTTRTSLGGLVIALLLVVLVLAAFMAVSVAVATQAKATIPSITTVRPGTQEPPCPTTEPTTTPTPTVEPSPTSTPSPEPSTDPTATPTPTPSPTTSQPSTLPPAPVTPSPTTTPTSPPSPPAPSLAPENYNQGDDYPRPEATPEPSYTSDVSAALPDNGAPVATVRPAELAATGSNLGLMFLAGALILPGTLILLMLAIKHDAKRVDR